MSSLTTLKPQVQPSKYKTGKTLGGPLQGEPIRQYDEFNCLTLIISAPKQPLGNVPNRLHSSLLPVMVYVHGALFPKECIWVLFMMSFIISRRRARTCS